MEKNYNTLRDRLDKLRKRGMDIPKNREKERGVIKRHNYYNLINGYKDPFLVNKSNYPAHADPNEDFYLPGTTPSHLEALYMFDENLRRIFLERILRIEEHLKDVIVQSFYEHHTVKGTNKLVDILHRESEYLRRNYYELTDVTTYVVNERSGHKYTVIGADPGRDATMMRKPKPYKIKKDEVYHSLIAILYSRIGQQRKKNKSISSYIDKHTYLPMWILTNIMTFGNVSKLFEILTLDVQLLVLKKLKINNGTLTNELMVLNASRIIHILSLFRNSCAHNERFYCNNVHTPIDDDFMGYLSKFPQSSQINNLKGGTTYLNQRQFKKIERHRHGIYSLMFCISLFLNKTELTKLKNDVKRELSSLSISLPTTPYQNVERLMGLDFDWYSNLTK
ncbi:Abi family protein [Bacillus haynesii]|uniref:Abi family protein n=1 Tax=Bacillus haynesii TaxID=1925021 RepID=UPI00228095F4|nr:Abi family protein [Bacillus haynesii]MCY9373431.1 Abi family protein [Bacillus haynesii]